MIKVYGYNKCSTVSKAIKHLKSIDEVDFFDFVNNQISKEELTRLIEKSKQPIDEFFNKRGQVYKELNLKDKLEKLNQEEKIELLLSDGKLIKRPLIEIKDKVLIGYNQDEIDNIIK